MGRLIDLSGRKFGKLTVIKRVAKNPSDKPHWMCRCDCGTVVKAVSGSNLRWKNSTNCGCVRKTKIEKRNEVHGATKNNKWTPEYISWSHAKKRCSNSGNRLFHRYGGRGISICNRWKNSFPAFLEDMGKRPRGKSLDRIDNDGNYEPGNCRWATRRQQNLNRSASSKLTAIEVRAIKNCITAGTPPKEIAKVYGVRAETVYAIKNRKTWTGE